MKKINIFYSAVCFFMICNLCNCNRKENSKLNILDSLKCIKDTNLTYLVKNHKPKIINYINGNCGTCLSHIDKWNSFYKKEKFDSIDFIFIIHTESKSFIYNIFHKKEFRYPFIFLLDKDITFAKLNNIENTDKNYTYLIDSEENIVINGCPFYGEKNINDYKYKLSLLKNKELKLSNENK